MSARDFFKVVVGIAGSTVIAGSAFADELTFFSPVSEKRPSSAYMRDFAAKAEELSGGDVQFQMNYPGSLGIEVSDLLRHLKRGFVGAGGVYGPYYNRDAPTITAAYVEGAISNFAAHEAAVPVIEGIYQQTFDKWGIEYVGYVQPPLFDVSLFCKEPVSTLEGLKDKKLRVWTAHQLETFTRLGISAQIIPQTEMYVALQTGVIDCTIYLGEVAPLMSLDEVAPNESYIFPFASIPVALGISSRKMAGLADGERKAIRDAGQWISEHSLRAELEKAGGKEEARKARAEQGFTQLPAFSDEDLAKIVTTAREVWLEMAEKAGPESVEAYNLLTK
ncbi:TRAP transporter substrate-binding protein DctP [Leisingera sp. XS_AS12]|uniref:TRAP transporter substrate-binding protein DctP n=1 Tax=Roseobacteraceae TaxID=2854170 RepID=UPI003512664A